MASLNPTVDLKQRDNHAVGHVTDMKDKDAISVTNSHGVVQLRFDLHSDRKKRGC